MPSGLNATLGTADRHGPASAAPIGCPVAASHNRDGAVEARGGNAGAVRAERNTAITSRVAAHRLPDRLSGRRRPTTGRFCRCCRMAIRVPSGLNAALVTSSSERR